MHITLLILSFCLFGQAFAFKHFVLISAPGSGKGTLAQYLVEKYDYVQVSPGDIFRNEVRLQTDLGKRITPAVAKGDLVDEAIVCELMERYLIEILAHNKCFVLDGFPRSEHSFHFLNRFIQAHKIEHEVCFIQLLVDDEVCIKRIVERQVCTQCFKVYNASSVKSKTANKCDQCGIDLVMRQADTEEPFRKRLEYFHAHIEPIIDRAKTFYPTKIINGERPLEALQCYYDELLKEEN